MSEPKKLTPQVVSRFLGQEFTRSKESRSREPGWSATYPGFKTRKGLGLPGEVRHVAVEHVLGSRDSTLLPEEQKRITRERLTAYRDHLEKRFRVTTNIDESGEYDTLLVWDKEEK